MRKARILVVEDSESMAELYREYLISGGYECDLAGSGHATLDYFQQQLPDAVILDINLPDMSGIDILRHIHDAQLPLVSLVVTGHGSVDLAVEAMALGAYDFIEKPFGSKRLLTTLSNALSHQTLNEQLESIKEEFDRQDYEGFIGSSLPMQGVYRIIDSSAPSNATVFITGESGTGKEVCAAAIHNRSDRKNKPFIALNCAAIPRDLMESEIFGHTKGAFTGAVSNRDGAASRADGGTLFLDELCEMDLDLQTKLLRFIQTGSFQKVGSNKTETVDVRFVCATNKDPLEEVKAGNFREDLYYRLHVIPVQLPPLREREGDIGLIMDKLLNQYAHEEGKEFQGFDAEAAAAMHSYEWPGNVRQLQNVIRNIVVLNPSGVISLNMLPPPLNEMTPPEMVPNPALIPAAQTLQAPASMVSAATGQAAIRPLWLVEKEVIEAAIDQCGGNIPRAAALLEVSASTIYRKRERWANA